MYMTLYGYKPFPKGHTGLNNLCYQEYRGIPPSCIYGKVWVDWISFHHLPRGGEGRDSLKPSQVIGSIKLNKEME